MLPNFLRCIVLSVYQCGPYSSSDAELIYLVRRAFVQFFLRAEISGRFCGPFPKNEQKTLIFRGQIWKLGGKICLPKIFNAFTGLRIWCRLSFCYQTRPNLIRWLSCGFLCHAQIALSPQNKNYTLTSRHQSAREETGEHKKIIKKCYARFSRISLRQDTGVEKEKK